jgi:predicted DNA-binding transcriptional regulator AlpA
MQPLLHSKQVETLLGFATGTLAVLRCRRSPNIPPHIKIGRAVRYRPEDIEQFLSRATSQRS